MNLNPIFPKNNPSVHVQNLQILQACSLYNTLPQIQRACPSVFNGTEGFFWTAPQPTMTDCKIFTDGKQALVVLGGMTLLSQAANLISSWVLPGLASDAYGANPYYVTAANALTYFLTQVPGFFSVVRVLGFSMGGGIASAWWIRSTIRYTAATEPVVFTYGAPRSFNKYWRDMSDSPNVSRCVGFDDVVPNIPPWPSECPSIALLLTRAAATAVATQQQPCNAITIDGAGNTGTARNVPIVISPVQGALPQWLLGTQTEGSTPHSIATYLARWVTNLNGSFPSPPPIPTRPLPGPLQTDNRAQAALERAAVIQASQLAVSNPAAQIALSTPNLVLAKGTKFTRATIRKVRYVAYGQELVCVCENKRNQRKMVRLYNDWLRTNPGFLPN